MKKLLNEFKKFATRGNVIDLATGVIIGGAFGKIVTSLVNDVVMPCISIVTGKIGFDNLKLVLSDNPDAASLNYGTFITNVLDFLIIAVVVFIVVSNINKLFPKPAPPPSKPMKECPYCISSIPEKATRCPHCTAQIEIGPED